MQSILITGLDCNYNLFLTQGILVFVDFNNTYYKISSRFFEPDRHGVP
jgi:hypothetical protein